MVVDVKELGTTLAPKSSASDDPLAMVTAAAKEAGESIVAQLGRSGYEIILLEASAAPVTKSQYPKLRVEFVILNIVTAGPMVLQVGSVRYPFDCAARDVTVIPFPLVIERGSDLGAIGADGRIYLIGKPE